MVHGDDRGLRIPPKMAPVEVVIVPIVRGDGRPCSMRRANCSANCKQAGLRVSSTIARQSPGFKFNEWDMRGVPLRIELGARDLEAGVAALVRRDRAFKEEGQKRTVPLDAIVAEIPALLDEIQALALRASQGVSRVAHDRDERSRGVLRLLDERAGMIDIAWCERPECEAAVKEATSATTRNLAPLAEAGRSHVRRVRRTGDGPGVFCAEVLSVAVGRAARGRLTARVAVGARAGAVAAESTRRRARRATAIDVADADRRERLRDALAGAGQPSLRERAGPAPDRRHTLSGVKFHRRMTRRRSSPRSTR